MEKPLSFNQKELEYLENTDFLLTKRKLIDQVQQMLALSQNQFKELLKDKKAILPVNCLQRAGKISKGENYRGLPYLVLDYPRLLAKDNIFSFRTMFWWGNFFSCTLHLQGHSLGLYRKRLTENLTANTHLLPPDTWIGVSDTPWEYHYQPSNYKILTEVSSEELNYLLSRDFIKLSRKIPLPQYRQLPTFCSESLRFFLASLS